MERVEQAEASLRHEIHRLRRELQDEAAGQGRTMHAVERLGALARRLESAEESGIRIRSVSAVFSEEENRVEVAIHSHAHVDGVTLVITTVENEDLG